MGQPTWEPSDLSKQFTALILRKPYSDVPPKDIARVREHFLKDIKEEAPQG